MESGTIPDSMISASSSYNEQSVGPQNARYVLASEFVFVPINIRFLCRLNRELNGGAWCPATQLDSKTSGKEWIQVNFSEPYVITKIATQGRFGNGMGLEYSETFWLHYTRDGITWIQWRNKYGEHVSAPSFLYNLAPQLPPFFTLSFFTPQLIMRPVQAATWHMRATSLRGSPSIAVAQLS